MRAFLIRLLTFLAIAHALPGFQVPGVGTAMVGALVYGIAGFFVRVVGVIALVVLVAGVATASPLLGVSLGLMALFTVDFLIALGTVVLTSWLVPGFAVEGWGTATLAAAVLAIVSVMTDRPSRPGGTARPDGGAERTIDVTPR
ncbi:MAG: phage holin family protein [Candidatus Riflebacteria bacterium]|nr:phage holin family protein [Candidatus Riflebacteria bacterium]